MNIEYTKQKEDKYKCDNCNKEDTHDHFIVVNEKYYCLDCADEFCVIQYK